MRKPLDQMSEAELIEYRDRMLLYADYSRIVTLVGLFLLLLTVIIGRLS